MKVSFSARSWAQYVELQAAEPNTLKRVNSLIQECMRSPFSGTGKPEPLKGELQGWWSRRITVEHRLVYRVTGKGEDQTLQIAQCRFHY